MINSSIVTSSDIEFAKIDVLSKINSKLIKKYFVDEFKIDDAKEVIHEAYIAEEHDKYLVIAATNYNVYAQNALLKLLEEPPRNIIFILIVKSKTSLLPTIRSRMKITHLNCKKQQYELGLDISSMNLKEIFDFLKKNRHVSKDEHKKIIETLLLHVAFENIELNLAELNMFDICMELAQLNTKLSTTLSYLLLTVLNAKSRK